MMYVLIQLEHLNIMIWRGPLTACKNVPSSWVTSMPKFRPTITNQPAKNFLSIYFFISSAIYCSFERCSTEWCMTCFASCYVYLSISEYLTVIAHFYYFFSYCCSCDNFIILFIVYSNCHFLNIYIIDDIKLHLIELLQHFLIT